MLLDFARAMRAGPTDAEHRLWEHLRAGRLPKFKFRRQQPLGNFIVDFVCLEARLIVELDGGQHNESASDIARDAWLASQGFVVLRFWNNEVFENLAGVVERILVQLQQPHPSPQPLSGPRPPRRKGRGARSRVRASPPIKSSGKNQIASFASLPPRGGGTEGEGEVPTKLGLQNEH
jgi:very-short-patch-repair endonuclease